MQGIPDNIKLFSFAKKRLVFLHTYQVGDFPRIKNIVDNINDSVIVALSFFEYDNIPCIEGEIKLAIVLDCQRCLNKIRLQLNPNFKLAFVKNEQQGEELDSSFDVILNQEEVLMTIEFITDEVLISIPMVPMHPHKCKSYYNKSLINKQEYSNPFAVLKYIKTETKE